ncbi:MAG: methyltransferase domain-containing protein [Candidatus Omnitrophica bacterium]|nr:methyltransferase domain-containing protein [Candidatus Omnitrophota bacterium]
MPDLKTPKIDILIPSRSGSKGLYRKSMVLLDFKPLIEYTLDAAVGAKHIRHVYLTTDEPDLLSKYKGYHGIRIIERPKVLSGDDVSIKDVILHALSAMDKNKPDILALLFPSAPLRTASHVDRSVEFAISLKSFDSVVSVTRTRFSPYGGLKLDGRNRAKFLLKDGPKYFRRQDQPVTYKLNGAIWIVKARDVQKLNDLLLGKDSYGFEMDEADSVNVETLYDIPFAEAMLSFRKERISWESRGGFNVQRFYMHDDAALGIRRTIFDAAAYERHFARYRFFLDHIEPSDSVLDIACGSGYGSELIAEKARLVTGVDGDAKTIEYAKRHHSRENIAFQASSAEMFCPKCRYDKIISVETIEHLTDPAAFLSRAKGWLKPKGELWLTCPLADKSVKHVDNPFHISEMTYEEINKLMKSYFRKAAFFNLSGQDIFSRDTLNNKTTYIIAKGTC